MSEAKEQKQIVKWFRDTYPDLAPAFSLSMNGVDLGGGKKAAIMMNHLKAQGLHPGECDFKILVPRGAFHGLCIELKKTGWKVSGKAAVEKHQKQINYLNFMTEQGYLAALCIGKEAAIDTIKAYLD